MITDAVLLAGGNATRLAPFNKFISKNLMNVNGKCVIEYSIETLKKAGIQNLTIIVGSIHAGQIIDYIQDGSQYELNVNYCYQKEPRGISHGINQCKRYIKNDFLTILGDNYFTNNINWLNLSGAAEIVLLKHHELKRFGVASIKNNKIVAIEEKPKVLNDKLDQYAIVGCYKFTNEFFDYFEQTIPSNRQEYEIVDVIKLYQKNNKLNYNIYDGKWWDIGTHEAIADVNHYLHTLNFKD